MPSHLHNTGIGETGEVHGDCKNKRQEVDGDDNHLWRIGVLGGRAVADVEAQEVLVHVGPAERLAVVADDDEDQVVLDQVGRVRVLVVVADDGAHVQLDLVE